MNFLFLFLTVVISKAHADIPQTEACKEFVRYSTQQIDKKKKRAFNTDGLVIQKDGKVLFEFYDGDERYSGDRKRGLYRKETPHCLWSASKTISTTIVGRAIHDRSSDLSLETPLAKFFSSEISQPQTSSQIADYQRIKIENLINMSSNFVWDESYDSKVETSTFLPMLYSKSGNRNMLKYALSQPMACEGPGNRWNYSGGNSIILLSILKSIFGKKDFRKLPWTLLFDPLKMSKVVFERDGSGIFIGNSYVHMTPGDMAKFGQLYLDQGILGENRLLDESWITESQKISPAVLNPNTPIKEIQKEGVYSNRAFWLNQPAQGYGPEFINSPKDMYFAAGHYGQLIIVLPTQKMVIARTGHDPEYWSKIDSFTSKAVNCFAPESGADPIPTPTPEPASKAKLADLWGDAKFALRSNLLPNLLAKELCSCMMVTEASKRFGKKAALKKCIDRSNLPFPKFLLHALVKFSVDEKDRLTIGPRALGKLIGKGKMIPATATFHRNHPEYGCSL